MIVIEKQGSMISMRDLSLDVLRPSKPAKRGKVTEFSDASRRRLIELTARLDVENVRCVFLTLTFAGYPHPDEAKAAFRRFLKRIHRKFPQCSGLWRAEMQKRGSPHFHLILFDFPFVEQSTIFEWWTACTREERSFVWIVLMKHKRQVMSYVSKYVAKKTSFNKASYLTDTQNIDRVEENWQGRHWGVFNAACLPMGERKVTIVRDSEIMEYFRWTARKIAHNYKVGRSPIGVTLLTHESEAMYQFVLKLSHDALKADDLEPDNRYMASRATRKRIQKFFRISPRAMNSHPSKMSLSGAPQGRLILRD